MRPIDGDALKERLQSLAYDDWNQGVSTSWADAYREIAGMVEEMPEIPPKKAHWMVDEDGTFVCSNCHEGYSNQPTLMGRPMFDYCPVCGASMEGGTDE